MGLLEAENVSKRFGGIWAVRNVSCHIEKGEILGLIGPNGAGKTTLFNLIAGNLRPETGTISFNGTEITRLRPYEICKLGIARTFQLVKPFLSLTVQQNALVGIVHGRSSAPSISAAVDEATQLLQRVSLADSANELVGNLSFIGRKKVELVRALSTHPSLLLLDEPVAGLNPTETQQYLQNIQEINSEGITVFIIEHVMRAVMGISNRIIVLHHGEKIAEGTPQEVSQDKHVIDIYLGGE